MGVDPTKFRRKSTPLVVHLVHSISDIIGENDIKLRLAANCIQTKNFIFPTNCRTQYLNKKIHMNHRPSQTNNNIHLTCI